MSVLVRPGGGGGSYPYEIYVVTPPNKTEYTAGDTLSLSGMTVKAKFNNGKEKDITDEVTTVPADGSVLNDYEVTAIDITWENKGLEYKTSTPITIDLPWELISWGTGTPEQIQKMLQAHYDGKINIHDYWAIGDERPVELTTGETAQMVLMHPTYPLADGGTAAFVVGMKDCLNATHSMNSSSTNAGGWNACAMRSWLNSTIYNQIPESFRQNLKLMNVWTANGGNQSGTTGVYSEDYLALPAEKEVFGSNSYANSSIESQLFQFDWHKTAANRIKKVNGSNHWWWERSPNRSNTNYFCNVNTSGRAGFSDAYVSGGVSFFGCI